MELTPRAHDALLTSQTAARRFDPEAHIRLTADGAVTVAGLLPNSALLTVHGWGHTSLFLSACADEAITRYLVDRQTPPAGTVCEQDVVPFSQ